MISREFPSPTTPSHSCPKQQPKLTLSQQTSTSWQDGRARLTTLFSEKELAPEKASASTWLETIKKVIKLKVIKFILSYVWTRRMKEEPFKDLHLWDKILPEEPSKQIGAVFLGVLPLKSDMNKIKAALGDKAAILCMTEEFENKEDHPGITPAKPNDWKENGVQFKQCPMVDFTGASLTALVDAVEWLKKMTEAGTSVYVHCKAGVGRSALVVLAHTLAHRVDLQGEWATYCINNPQASREKFAEELIKNARNDLQLIRHGISEFELTESKGVTLKIFVMGLLNQIQKEDEQAALLNQALPEQGQLTELFNDNKATHTPKLAESLFGSGDPLTQESSPTTSKSGAPSPIGPIPNASLASPIFVK